MTGGGSRTAVRSAAVDRRRRRPGGGSCSAAGSPDRVRRATVVAWVGAPGSSSPRLGPPSPAGVVGGAVASATQVDVVARRSSAAVRRGRRRVVRPGPPEPRRDVSSPAGAGGSAGRGHDAVVTSGAMGDDERHDGAHDDQPGRRHQWRARRGEPAEDAGLQPDAQDPRAGGQRQPGGGAQVLVEPLELVPGLPAARAREQVGVHAAARPGADRVPHEAGELRRVSAHAGDIVAAAGARSGGDAGGTRHRAPGGPASPGRRPPARWSRSPSAIS